MAISPLIFVTASALLLFIASCAVILVFIRIAHAQEILDVPNIRSSHTAPVPRGAGIAIVLASLSMLGILTYMGMLSVSFAIATGAAGAAIAIMSFCDDIFGGVSWKARFIVQFAASVWAIYWVGGIPIISLGFSDFYIGFVGNVLGVLVLMWMTNLYNFMDGIDGSSGSETVFIGLTGFAILAINGHWDIGMLYLAPAVSAAAFLIWNWSPAKIFMGDVGAAFIGFLFGILPIICLKTGTMSPWIGFMLPAVFVTDASITLLVRAVQGERLYEAHRTHAFQHFAQKHGHAKTVLVMAAVNLAWILPLSLLANHFKPLAFVITIAAYVPLIIAAFLLSAGRKPKLPLKTDPSEIVWH